MNFNFLVSHTIVNGKLIYEHGNFINETNGKELVFDN